MSDLDQQKMDHDGEKGVEPIFGCGPGTVLRMEGHDVNASGHPDQLQRQYSIWSICGLALTIDNAWVALGGSILVAVGML
jgi:choline transport protein